MEPSDGGGTIGCFGEDDDRESHVSGYGVFSPIDRRSEDRLDDDSLPNSVEDDFRCVVQIEFLHEIRSVGFDR